MKARALVLVTVVVTTAVGVESANAATCGETPRGSRTVKRGTLALSSKDSRTTLDFKRRQDQQVLSLVFSVRGCEIPRRQPRPDVAIDPPGLGEALPPGAAVVRRANAHRPSEVKVDVTIDPTKIDPGIYAGVLTVRSRYLTTTRAPVAVSRSVSSAWGPILLGAVCGLLGLFWLGLTKLATANNSIHLAWWWLLLVIPAAIFFGGVAGYQSWHSQDVFTWNDNLEDVVLAGTAGATSGAMLSLLGALGWSKDEPPGAAGSPQEAESHNGQDTAARV